MAKTLQELLHASVIGPIISRIKRGRTMTESEWLASEDPETMLRLRRTDCCGCLWVDNGNGTVSLAGGQRPCGQCDNGPILPYTSFSDRKLCLFACACCRQVWHLLTDERSRKVVEVTEQYADGLATVDELAAARDAARTAWTAWDAASAAAWVAWVAWDAARAAANVVASATNAAARTVARTAASATNAAASTTNAAWDAASASQANLLRDIFGNPFRPVSVNAAWLTPTVVSLGQAAYEDRDLPSGELDLARLMVLADALEEAGCTDDAILTHLRSPGPHVRGCWALDLILGKG